MLEVDPVRALEETYDRVLAMEAHKTRVRELQAPLIEELESLGAEVLGQSWRFNHVDLRVDADLLDQLIARDDVLRIEERSHTSPNVNYGGEIRHAAQIDQFIAVELDGRSPSGLNLASNIYVAVIDDYFDEDHPSITDRLEDWWYWDENATMFQKATTQASATAAGTHGQMVTAQLIANAMEDPAVTMGAGQKSGMTIESSFTFVMKRDPIQPTEQASISPQLLLPFDFDLEFPDVVNFSQSISGMDCDNDTVGNDLVNDLFHQGVFVVTTAGNNGHLGTTCTSNSPGLAAASFTVNAFDGVPTDLFDSAIADVSNRGGDALGRAVFDLVATDRQSASPANYDDGYVTSGYHGTSFAAPVVAGAAANFKHNLISTFSQGHANVKGHLFAGMLLMGDGQLEGGGKANSTNPQPDEVWGMGRIRMRRIDDGGLDAPAGFSLTAYSLEDGQSLNLALNGGSALPAAVDLLKVTVYWFEPNLEDAQNPAAADIAVELCDQSNNCYDSNSTEPGVRRVIAPSPGGKTWTLNIDGTAIPISGDTDFAYGEDLRRLRIGVLWEDQLRDDANGPSCGDDIDLDCDLCCAQAGASCSLNECN